MRALDRRLLHRARATRAFVLACAALGLTGAAAVIGQAALLAAAISAVVNDGAGLADLRPTLLALAATVAVRAVVAWAGELAAHRAAAAVKADLRRRLFTQVAALGPGWLHGERTGEITTLATHGLDALDGYFSRYLPQVVLAALVPAAVLAAVAPVDLLAGLTIALTVPLIPVFMSLVGQATERYNQRQFAVLGRLSHHFLEIVAGLPTLRAFGRAKAQAATIRTLTDSQRRITMRTLRLAFMSSLVLELLATVSVALVAVGVGLRVVGGSLDLRTALLVLILAPEAYLPLRQLATSYHASAQGLAAAGRIFAILAQPPPPRGTRTDLPEAVSVTFDRATVHYPGRTTPALADFSLRLVPGQIVALTGPSGCGKSTVLHALLGFAALSHGQITIDHRELSDVDMDRWRARIGWLPQRPYLFAGSVADNIRLGSPDATDAQVRRAAILAQAGDLLSTVVGEDGRGLSDGQRQRVALARALLRDAAVLLLDEPTAHLDPVTEAAVTRTIRELGSTRTVLMVAHRPALLAIAEKIVVVEASPASTVAAV